MTQTIYVDYIIAREFAHSLKLKGKSDWELWTQSNKMPVGIPKLPSQVYAKKGWKNWDDFLEIGNTTTKKRTFLPYEDAKTYAKLLGFTTVTQWRKWAKSSARPTYIPAYPDEAYEKKGWISYSDFLGSEIVNQQNRVFRPFEEAKAYARSLKFKTQNEWRQWAKSISRPQDIPACPNEVYAKHGWCGFGDFLGTGTTANQNREFLSFEYVRDFARSLNLTSSSSWRKWVKTKECPENIPKNPPGTYKNEWKGWGDFLGTGYVASKNRVYRSFEEARIFARLLKLRGKDEWVAWSQTNARPNDIPASPSRKYKGKGWVDWEDFLGKAVSYRKFYEAREYARELHLRSQVEWLKWAKLETKPQDIPRYPNKIYSNLGWKGWGDFLGTGKIACQNRPLLSFDKARSFVRCLGIKSKSEWAKWAKTNAKPQEIPAAPSIIYKGKGWNGWGDFLGTGYIAPQDRTFKEFDDARAYARSLGFKSEIEWNVWATTNARPSDIPSSPRAAYKGKGWKGFGDFLGTGYVANQNRTYRSFEDARIFARSLGFKTGDEWMIWAKTHAKPIDIPANPPGVYPDQWQGWGDWLDFFSKWSVQNIRLFVASLLPHLNNFSAAGLYVLFQQTGILEMDRNSRGRSFVQALKTGRFPKEELEKFINSEASLVDEFLENSKLSLEDCNSCIEDSQQAPENGLSENETTIQEDLPIVDTQGILSTLDSKLFSTLDKEAIDFFVKEAVARIWQHAFLNEAQAIQQLAQYLDEGTYSKEVKRLFLHDYHGAKELHIPPGYHFPFQPNLMQRYTAYLIKTRKRLGNWSGTGAGKTLSAILASRVIGANLTVICCPNNVMDNWKRNILEIYPESTVIIKDIYLRNESAQRPQYLILNYEFFQQPRAESNLKALLEKHLVDFIIIDEIHYSKQRQAEKISLRKKAISAFLSEASVKNDNLYVLGMSATPVINNLFEGKTLIELVTGTHHDELNTTPTVPNCISHYQKFVSHGIRWVPQYSYKLNLRTEHIDCSQFISEIKHQSLYGSMVDLEAVLTKAKLPFILDSLKPKTIVYTHYIKDILPILQEAIEKKGWRVAVFTGDNKDGLEAFIDGASDILIASSCVGTGVDRLQHVCNRLIVNSLPWTHAEFEQLKGRIYRQGQISDYVDVIVPLTGADINGEKWSWCDSRWKRIQFKKSISDAAVDGVIPEGHLRSPAQAYKDTMLWLERLERGEVYEIERRKISIPLSDEVPSTIRRRLGDLSQMNYQINRASSDQTHQRFQEQPEEWECYHSIYREDRKNWPVVPYEEAIKWFKARPHMVIGDFGCGEALLAANIENQVFSFDHVAINENVTACDMCHTALDDACLDAVVFSLSLMGSNFVDYLREAYRCLKLDGHLWIAEPTSRIKDIKLFQDLLFRLGFDVSRVDEKWKFTFIKAIKSEREPNLKALESLNPKLALD